MNGIEAKRVERRYKRRLTELDSLCSRQIILLWKKHDSLKGAKSNVIKKGILGLIVGAGIFAVSKIVHAGGIIFTDGSFQTGASAVTFERFTADGTWTKPDSATIVIVECIGAGGGGAGGEGGDTSTARFGGPPETPRGTRRGSGGRSGRFRPSRRPR